MASSVLGRAIEWGRRVAAAPGHFIRLNAGFRDELEPTPMPLRWLNAGLAALTIVTVGLIFWQGISDKMHRVAPDAVDMLAQTVAVDLSQRFHGTKGYVGRSEILAAFFEGGFTGRQNYLDKLGITYPANSEMPDLINKVIQAGVAMKDLPADATFGNQRLFAPEANDPGFVDYISWAFDVFGFRVEAFYYFYFLVLAISIALFLLCYHADALPLFVLLAAMVALLTLIDSQLFLNMNLRTVHNQRFLGSLCLVPYLHLLFTFLVYRRPTWSRVTVTILQATLFTLLMFTRSSAFWMILSFASIIGICAVFRFSRPSQESKSARLANLALSWPSLLVVGGLLVSLLYKAATLHPIYSLDIYIPYHMVWHNAYMGLGAHPEWKERGDKHKGKPIPDALSDNMAWMGAVAEGDERYGITEGYLNNNVVGGYAAPRIRLHEWLIKDRFLRFAFHNPLFIMETYLWYKPKMFFQELAWAFEGYRWKFTSLLCQFLTVILAVATWRLLEIPAHVRKTSNMALVVTGVMGLIPIVWTYPLRHVIGESLLIWFTVIIYFATYFLSSAWAMISPRFGGAEGIWTGTMAHGSRMLSRVRR